MLLLLLLLFLLLLLSISPYGTILENRIQIRIMLQIHLVVENLKIVPLQKQYQEQEEQQQNKEHHE